MIEVMNAPRLAPLAHRVTGSDLSTVVGGTAFGRRADPEVWTPPVEGERAAEDFEEMSPVLGMEEYLRKVDSDLFRSS